MRPSIPQLSHRLSLFKAFVLDADNLIPKVAPHAIQKIEIIEGNGLRQEPSRRSPSVKPGSQFKYSKHRIDEVDQANFKYSYSLIEGDALGDKLEKISYETKLVPSPDGGTIWKNISKYHTKGDPRSRRSKLRLVKRRPQDFSRLLRPTSWHTLMSTTKACVFLIS
ncbi:Major pollen allergen Bet v 1-M/N [Morella rubra]|uniref:Major pollen allergen Bet v 1-M/N n=1 Tax=Morella rubra TaxID=262757 RepID=A0A6A1VMP3_9ROSI|nr:Major pollen allergen Bet v 1-M/N [Morella rubra]